MAYGQAYPLDTMTHEQFLRVLAARGGDYIPYEVDRDTPWGGLGPTCNELRFAIDRWQPEEDDDYITLR